MPRSPSDATRFTATGPYVTTKPAASSSSPTNFASNTSSANPHSAAASSSSGTQINFGSAPAGETPQQKIARLRAAAALAKRGQESQFDQAVRVGRTWADRLHRFTALGLIGLTVVAGAVATAGITDMLLHNRRRRNQWLAEKQAETARDLVIAKRAREDGVASEDQLLLINRERIADEAAEAKKNRPGAFKRATSWLSGGLADEEQKGGRLGAAVTSIAESNVVQEASEAIQSVAEKVDASRRRGERAQELLTPDGGPLDRQAQVTANAASNTTRSWMGWISGK